MATEDTAVATVESLDDAKDQTSAVRLWLDAISIATTEEQDWRKTAQNAFDLYRQSTDKNSTNNAEPHKKFNILHANVETLCPALYNSTPIPDVRRRFNDPDPISKTVADLQERCLSYSIESYDFDHVMKLAVSDSEIGGRAVSRVRYKPYLGKDEKLAYQEVTAEHVNWKHFRRGPGYLWDDVPWIAFELFLTRDELEKLSKKYGSEVNLDVAINKPDDKTEDRNIPEIFKRARVWEIWDKDNRKVIFIAESFKQCPIREEKDPLELEGFFPIPRPLYAVTTSNSLIPIVPYEIYKAQAEELERVSERIMTLTEAVKAKALYDPRIGSEMELMEKADDADNVPVQNLAMFMDGTKLADHVMWYPIEIIVGALEKLYLARDQIKATIYEITGISDILRGESQANETATAQNIKQQWGSLRIQNKQQEIQRYARDIFRIKAELFANKFEPQFLEMMTGIKLMPQQTGDPQADQQAQEMAQQVIQMLKSDALRGFRVDVESDSTIRADMTRNQQNMSLFLQGTAQFAQAMGPIVMTFKEMTPAVIDVYSAFARNFKLGKQAEDALDKVGQLSQQMAKQPAPPDPAQQIEQQKMQMEQQKLQAEQQAKAQELQMKSQESQAKLAADQQTKEQKLQFEAQKHAQEMQFQREKHMSELAMRQEELKQSQVQHEQTLGVQQQQHAQDLNAQQQQHSDTMANEQQKTAADVAVKREGFAATAKEGEAARELTSKEGEASRNFERQKATLPKEKEFKELKEMVVALHEDLSAPVEIIRDKKGIATGTKKGKRVMNIHRGSDGKAAGLN